MKSITNQPTNQLQPNHLSNYIMKSMLLFIALACATFTLCTDVQAQAAGTLDASFGVGGVAKITNLSAGARDAAFQSNGKIVAVGFKNAGLPDNNIIMCRFNANGTLDSTFGTNGIVSTHIPHRGGSYRTLKILANDKILVTGRTIDSLTSENSIVIAKYNADGTLDNTFGSNGFVVPIIPNLGSLAGSSIDLQPDNKIIIGSFSFDGDVTALIRLMPNGSMDTNFGTNGIVKYIPSNFGLTKLFLPTAKYLSSGKILWGGSTVNFSVAFRLNSNGSLDTNFGSNGIDSVYTPSVGFNNNLLLKPDGKFIMTGNQNIAGGYIFAYLRGQNGGVGDVSFANNGMFKYYNGTNQPGFCASYLQQNGKIIISASIANEKIFRLNSNGTIDTTFGNAGYAGFGSTTSCGFYMINIQPDNKIVLSGLSGSPQRFTLLRYNAGTVVSNETAGSIVANINLFPNPITQTTTLNYTLQSDTNISIVLHDMLGRTVATFVENQTQAAGQHTEILVLNKDLPSGIYFLNIVNFNTVQSIKIIK